MADEVSNTYTPRSVSETEGMAGNGGAPPPLSFFISAAMMEQTMQYVNHLREFRMMEEARDQARGFEDLFATYPEVRLEHPDEYRILNSLLWVCKAVCFPLLDEKEIIELMRTRVGLMIDIYQKDLWDAVRGAVLKIYSYTERDKFKDDLLGVLIHSQERITTQGPVSGGKEMAPTVENWIKNYTAAVGTGYADALKRSEYLTRNQNIIRLPEHEKIRVRLVMMLRDKLPLSSYSLEGLEETISLTKNGKPIMLREGREEEIPQAEYEEYKRLTAMAMNAIEEEFKPVREQAMKKSGITVEETIAEEPDVSPSEKLLRRYEQWTQEETMHAALKYFDERAKSSIDSSAMLQQFFEGINRRNIAQVVGAAWLLARAGDVRAGLGQADRYIKYFEHYLRKSDSQFHVPDTNDQVRDFLKGPAAPLFLLAFLKHVLMERLKMNEETAKLSVVMLSNECRKAGEMEYAKLAYGDLKTGEFKWMDETENTPNTP